MKDSEAGPDRRLLLPSDRGDRQRPPREVRPSPAGVRMGADSVRARETPHLRDRTLVFPEERVIRSRSVELSRTLEAVVDRPGSPFKARRPADFRRALRTLAHRLVFYPDPQIGWYPAAVRAGTRAVRQQRFDAVLSSSFPITAHLIAMRISRRGGLPWAASFEIRGVTRFRGCRTVAGRRRSSARSQGKRAG